MHPLLFIRSNITGDFPPCFILTSTGDFLMNEPAHIIPTLEAKGVRYVSKLYGDDIVKPGHVFHCDIKSEIGRQADDDELKFFKDFIV